MVRTFFFDVVSEQVREMNMYKGVSMTHFKFEFDPENLWRCWDECKVKSDYDARRKSITEFNKQNRWKKRGLSLIPIKYGIAFAEGLLNKVKFARKSCESIFLC